MVSQDVCMEYSGTVTRTASTRSKHQASNMCVHRISPCLVMNMHTHMDMDMDMDMHMNMDMDMEMNMHMMGDAQTDHGL
jgi:hypothetical protein